MLNKLLMDNKFLQPAQETLYQKFQAILEQLDLDIGNSEKALKSAESQREAEGVLLYDEQQKLGKIQASISQCEEELDVAKNDRIKAEEEAKLLESKLQQLNKAVQDKETKRRFVFD